MANLKIVYTFKVKDIDNKETSLEQFVGKTQLIVNVASRCGFTSQYAGLEQLYQKYRDRGLVVLGFPCNQFAHQEPGDEAEIKNFCSTKYNVTFPMFGKINVNGEETHPLYKFLKKSAKGILNTENIKWNFTKFLVDKNGTVVHRFAPITSPKALEKEIEKVL